MLHLFFCDAEQEIELKVCKKFEKRRQPTLTAVQAMIEQGERARFLKSFLCDLLRCGIVEKLVGWCGLLCPCACASCLAFSLRLPLSLPSRTAILMVYFTFMNFSRRCLAQHALIVTGLQCKISEFKEERYFPHSLRVKVSMIACPLLHKRKFAPLYGPSAQCRPACTVNSPRIHQSSL